MASQRPPKTESSSPDPYAVAGGGGASSDKLYDISQRLSRVEASITYLEGHADEARKKLDTISDLIIGARASFNTAKYILGAMGGAICVGLWGIIGMWVKHHYGW